MVTDQLSTLIDMVTRLAAKVDALIDARSIEQREYVNPKEFAERAGLRPDTVRDHLRRGRIQGTHRACGRGGRREWKIPTAELKRYQDEGLRPVVSPEAHQLRIASHA